MLVEHGEIAGPIWEDAANFGKEHYVTSFRSTIQVDGQWYEGENDLYVIPYHDGSDHIYIRFGNVACEYGSCGSIIQTARSARISNVNGQAVCLLEALGRITFQRKEQQ